MICLTISPTFGFDRDRLTFEVVHIVNTADYNKYMDIQQEINIRILEGLNAQEIKLALPSMVLHAPWMQDRSTEETQTAIES